MFGSARVVRASCRPAVYGGSHGVHRPELLARPDQRRFRSRDHAGPGRAIHRPVRAHPAGNLAPVHLPWPHLAGGPDGADLHLDPRHVPHAAARVRPRCRHGRRLPDRASYPPVLGTMGLVGGHLVRRIHHARVRAHRDCGSAHRTGQDCLTGTGPRRDLAVAGFAAKRRRGDSRRDARRCAAPELRRTGRPAEPGTVVASCGRIDSAGGRGDAAVHGQPVGGEETIADHSEPPPGATGDLRPRRALPRRQPQLPAGGGAAGPVLWPRSGGSRVPTTSSP